MAIRTIGIGGDFSSPRAWEASLPAVLTEPEIALLLVQDFSSLSDLNATFDINVTTSAANYIVIDSIDAFQDFAANPLTVPFFRYGRGGTFGVVTLRNGCDHIRIGNFTVEISANSSNIIRDIRTTVAADSFVEAENLYCYPSASPGGQGGSFIQVPDTTGFLRNSILVTNNNNGPVAADVFEYTNCTIVCNFTDIANDRVGIRSNTAVGSITQRCAVFNFGPTAGARDYLDIAPTFTDNAASDTTGNVGFQNLALLNQYTDPINHDWTFALGNSLEGAAVGGLDIGVLLPGSGPTPQEILLDLTTTTNEVYNPILTQQQSIQLDLTVSTNEVYDAILGQTQQISLDVTQGASLVYDATPELGLTIGLGVTQNAPLVYDVTLTTGQVIDLDLVNGDALVYDLAITQPLVIGLDLTIGEALVRNVTVFRGSEPPPVSTNGLIAPVISGLITDLIQ